MKIPIDVDNIYKVSCVYATEHRCGVKISGPGLSSAITGTDPIKDNKKLVVCQAIDGSDEKAKKTAELVNSLSDGIREKLEKH